MSRSILGLDIRDEAITAVRVRRGLRETRLESSAYMPVEPHEDIFSAWHHALGRIAGQMDLSASTCAVAFPADRMSFRHLRVPFDNRKKIRQILPFELEPELVIPVEDLVIEFEPLDLTGGQSKAVDLMIAALERKSLTAFVDLLESFHVKPDTVTIGGYAAACMLTRKTENSSHLLFADLENNRCTLFFIVSGKVCLVRTFSVNPREPSPAGAIGSRVRQSILAFDEICRLPFTPESLFVNGPVNTNGAFGGALADALQLPVIPVDFTRDTDPSAQVDRHRVEGDGNMNNAMALVLAEIDGVGGMNFFKQVYREKKFWIEHRPGLIRTGVLAGLVGGLALLNFGMGIRAEHQHLDRLNTRITETFQSAFPEVKNIVDPLHQMRTMVSEARTAAELSGVTGDQRRVVSILNDLSLHIPNTMDVELDRFDVGPDSVLLTGSASNFNTVDEVKSGLEQAGTFKSIAITSTSKDKSGNRVQFKLKITP